MTPPSVPTADRPSEPPEQLHGVAESVDVSDPDDLRTDGGVNEPAASARRVRRRWVWIGVGLCTLAVVAGAVLLGQTPHWPPREDLDRLLVIVLPAAVLAVAFPSMVRARDAATIRRVALPLTAIGVAAGLGTALVTGILFGVLPARRAAQLDPVQALSKR